MMIKKKNNFSELIDKDETLSDLRKDSVNQIKNITQEEKIKPELDTKIKEDKKSITSFNQLLEVCSETREMKLKYELEKNVNLVSFDKQRIEISFNDNLDKNFVKDLSLKLFEWTDQRWIITFSKSKGEISIKEKEENKKQEIIKKGKNSELYKNVLEKFSDANLLEVIAKREDE